MCLWPTQGDEERWWRELQLAASASAGGRAANFGLFFSGAVLNSRRLREYSQPRRAVGISCQNFRISFSTRVSLSKIMVARFAESYAGQFGVFG
jgi:hypothetical protein